ncbi:G patch domain-containing protein 4-like [Sinocyclocheilus grahami]|uniref:G patch domain-containing protein 4 n=1 Tax=Sinocyclocheilus grahami TaxID=75366 RepID=A0A672QL72_SINGR|nr:PREDICTED: G patch domain-containing protein 4-like [Sinocyclocheilus grahami]XP_016085731.1 PREDICTED: G patch domain-containing protein 4-like [Sinocyclocheilus grahami]
MAEMVQEKNTGLKFAEEQLLRHGWEKGKGLGRYENGISEAIKVKIKCDKGGMGHKEGEQFSFHWWDHVFNKASSGLVVESGQNGVVVKKSDDGNDGLISNKKPRKAQQAKSMLYGRFVKSATLLSGEKPEKTSDSDDSSSSSEDEDQKLDLSSTTKLSDADLLEACGGRTAHKGARHGLTMSAKLARLEQQEQEFMNKYGKKNHTAKTSTSSTDCLNPEGCPDMNEKTKRKKSKRQKEPSENNIHEDKMTTHILPSNNTENCKPKKRKGFNGASVNNDMIADTEPKKKKKRNRKEKEAPEDCANGDCSIDVNEAFTHTSEERDTHLPMDDSVHKKKKKKKQSKVDDETANTDEISEDSTNTQNKQPQEGSIEHQQASDGASKKKKKKKSSMEHYEVVDNSTTAMTVTEDTSNKAQIMDTQTEGQENDRKKNKKKKHSKKEQEVVENVQFEESVPKKKKKKSK